MSTPANSINAQTQGTLYFDGVSAFTGIDGSTAGDVLTSNGTGVAPSFKVSSNGASSIVTTFSSSGTWTPNAKMVTARMYLWNGGAGGGSGRCGTSAAAGGGGGGGAGNYSVYEVLKSNLQSSSYAVTIGVGGNGGAALTATLTDGNNGSAGGLSSVGVIVGSAAPAGITVFGSGGTTSGGTQGGPASYFIEAQITTNGIGTGGGGTTSNGSAPSSSGTSNYAPGTGGGGGAGYTLTTAHTGGAGAPIFNGDSSTTLIAGGLAGANTGANGGNGNNAIAFELFTGGTGGGGGGQNGGSTSGSGGNGGIPAGGGGGGAGALSGNTSGAGGAGGKGLVIIIEYF